MHIQFNYCWITTTLISNTNSKERRKQEYLVSGGGKNTMDGEHESLMQLCTHGITDGLLLLHVWLFFLPLKKSG
jgi:hypothetical protein